MNTDQEQSTANTEQPVDPNAYINSLNRHQRRKREKFLKKMGFDPKTFKGRI